VRLETPLRRAQLEKQGIDAQAIDEMLAFEAMLHRLGPIEKQADGSRRARNPVARDSAWFRYACGEINGRELLEAEGLLDEP
jgi:hypothetical protein